jgi:hypothetical protein
MKLLALLAVLLGLLSVTAAEARHLRHHHSELGLSFGRAVAHDVRNHLTEAGGPTSPSSASTHIPLPKPRPVHHLEVDLGPRLFEQIQPKWRQATPTETQRIGLQILALTMVQR